MAKQVKKSDLAARLGAKGAQAVEAHKTDETNYGQIELPAGIDGGVAQLVDCRFSQYEKGDNKGEYFFYAAGIVKLPKEVNGVPVEGQRTSIMEACCDTPGRSRESVEEHVAWILNELRKLGVDTAEMGIEDLEAAASALKEQQPHFRFRTWKGDKQTTGPYAGKEPRTNHQWQGVCEYDESDDDGAGAVQDDTDADAAPASDAEADLASLGELADGGDDEAIAKLSELAGEAGVDPNEIATWVEVAEAIAAAGEGGGEAADGADVPDPEKGNVYKYKPPKAKKPVECEVVAVFPAKQLVNLKNLDDGKSMYKAVPWDQLLSE